MIGRGGENRRRRGKKAEVDKLEVKVSVKIIFFVGFEGGGDEGNEE